MATQNYNNFQNTQTFDATLASPTGLINSPTPTAANPNPTAVTPLATNTPTPAAVGTSSGAQATAANWQVQPNQTVQSQIQAIIDKDSPLMQQAETRALQKANARGLMNSSMAVGAGQSALYDIAAPIAGADAATYAKAGEFNAGAQQQTNLANQTSTNQKGELETNVNLNNAAAANDMSKFKTSLDADIAKFNASESNDLKALGMDSQTKVELANIEASYKMLMQSNASAADLYKQMMQGTMTIMTNKDMDAATKSTAIKNQIAQLNNGLGIIGQISNLNLSNLLTFDVPGVSGASDAPATAPATAPPPSTSGPSGGTTDAYGNRTDAGGYRLDSQGYRLDQYGTRLIAGDPNYVAPAVITAPTTPWWQLPADTGG